VSEQYVDSTMHGATIKLDIIFFQNGRKKVLGEIIYIYIYIARF